MSRCGCVGQSGKIKRCMYCMIMQSLCPTLYGTVRNQSVVAACNIFSSLFNMIQYENQKQYKWPLMSLLVVFKALYILFQQRCSYLASNNGISIYKNNKYDNILVFTKCNQLEKSQRKSRGAKNAFFQTQDELRRCTEDQYDEGIFYTVNHAKLLQSSLRIKICSKK